MEGRTQPVYTRLSADAPGQHGRTRSIVLSKLAEIPYVVGHTPETHAQLRIDINKHDNIDPDEWVDWITQAPQCVQRAVLKFVNKDKLGDWYSQGRGQVSAI
jgi:hypothetical protein